MKIQTGDKKGHSLIHRPSPSIRPTTGKVREALVDILRSRGLILNSRVLDLFAGTGAVGFELLSNGARHVTFIEKSYQSFEFIRKNIARLGYQNCTGIIREDVVRACEQLIAQGVTFDIIYTDPPYSISDERLEKVIQLAIQLLDENGVLVIEHSTRRTFNLSGLKLLFQKKYGDTALSFYQKGDGSD